MATTALDLITGALLNINSYSPGEPLNASDGQTGLNVLNDLVDSLSNEESFVYTQAETVFPWINNQFQYSVGNPIGGTFLGTVTGGSNVITGVTNIPSNLKVGAYITDLAAVIPTGNNLVPVPTTVTAIGVNTVTLSAPATATPANPDQLTYTVPGDIVMPRPLHFRNGFSRSTTSSNASLDYYFEMVSFDRYKEELLKNINGPWPIIASYQPTFPYGTLYVYPNPNSGYTAHVFTDLIIKSFASLNSAYSLPEGYTRALKTLLSLELAPIYGKQPAPVLLTNAKAARELLKVTNANPVVTLRFDSSLVRADTPDRSWIMHGGFR
jgi:hypothetical protein